MLAARSDIELVMDNFGCDALTAATLIDAGINVAMLRDGIDDIIEPELNLGDEVKKVNDKLSEAVGQFQQNS